MRFREKILTFGLMLVAYAPLHSVEFNFIYNDGDNYRIVSEVYENVKLNNNIIFSKEFLNRIAVTVTGAEGDIGDINAVYQISERTINGAAYQWNSEESARFKRDVKGVYSGLEENAVLPAVRNVPHFPDGEIQPGDRWFFPGEEIHDLNSIFGINHVISIPFRAFYTYEGTVESEGRILDKIIINYNIFYEEDPLETYYKHPDIGDVFPEKIVGSFYQEYFWDREAGRPARVEGRFEFTYYLTTDDFYTFSGISRGNVSFAREMDRDQMAEEINRELEEDGFEDIQAEPAEEGVKITLEDIRFLPDSPVLEDSEIEKLERISEILLRYPDRDILITGHTARFGTEESSQILSEERAAAVASYLLEMKIRDESEIVTRGFGSRRPIGNNATIEGQKMNRRVEITILEN